MDFLKEVAKGTFRCCAAVVLLYSVAVATAVEKVGDFVFSVLDEDGSGQGNRESSSDQRNNVA